MSGDCVVMLLCQGLQGGLSLARCAEMVSRIDSKRIWRSSAVSCRQIALVCACYGDRQAAAKRRHLQSNVFVMQRLN